MDKDIPPMLSASPPPMERGFAEMDDDEETPTGFSFGRLDAEDEAEMVASSRTDRKKDSLKRKEVLSRQAKENTVAGTDTIETNPAALANILADPSAKATDVSHNVGESAYPIESWDELKRDPEECKTELEQLPTVQNKTADEPETQMYAEKITNNSLSESMNDPGSSNIAEFDYADDSEAMEFCWGHAEQNEHANSPDNSESVTIISANQERMDQDAAQITNEWITLTVDAAALVDSDLPGTDVLPTASGSAVDLAPELIDAQTAPVQNIADSVSSVADDSADHANPENGSVTKVENDDTVDDDWAEFTEFPPTELENQPDDGTDDFDDFQSVSVAEKPIETVSDEIAVTFDAVLQKSFPEKLLPDDNSVTGENGILSTSVASGIAADVWASLENLNETSALKFQWLSSVSRQKMLSALNLNPNSVFAMQKKEPVALHSSRYGETILTPVKVETNAVQKDQTSDIAMRTVIDTQLLSDLATFDAPTTHYRTPSTVPSPNTQNSKDAVASLSSSQFVARPSTDTALKPVKMTNGVIKPLPGKSPEEEAQEIVKRFRNLDFMQSATLINSPIKPSTFQKF